MYWLITFKISDVLVDLELYKKFIFHIWPPSIKFDHGSTSWLFCLIVAASLVAVETDVGETISDSKVVFMCGIWSVEVVALLSAGPSSNFCIH